MAEMEKNYEPAKNEAKWTKEWLDGAVYHSDSSRGGEPYAIVIPPPNVTGILHMGHALNNTIQDILVRRRRMQGFNAIWIPGTDHAGIATQNVVEKTLAAEGKSRNDLGREAFVGRVWQWKEKYGGTIVNQLKRLGASCDWQRERFTMDEQLSDAVAEAFIRLYDKGLIYRGNYIINWCPRCHTALSDEESEHRESNGKLYYLRYPVKDHPGVTHLTVATTRPETMLGDTAVAVNPSDPRYGGLVGKKLVLPLLNREIPVIADDFVSVEFGTGAVKVTPAHDPNDFEIGRRHNLKQINVMHGDGRMNAQAGQYEGLDRFECRKRVLEDLKAQGLLEKIEDHKNAVGHCYRCDTVVEPRLSPQWFVKMKPLAAPAIEAVKQGRIVFVPERWTKVYLEWMENIRDWCISRQIWWGHRIPVFTCLDCGHEWAAKGKPAKCPKCARGKLRQEEDVLDTWFSSWLWPFSTLGWPGTNADLKYYYPTNDLVTASEIIFFWVARMIMAGFEFMGDVPFRRVYIHGTVRDDKGRKMSKSLGNSIDPVGIIDAYSADALRFSLMMITATGQDVYLSNDKFEIGRNFGTKLWNAARFMKMHAETSPVGAGLDMPDLGGAALGPDDQYILHSLHEAIAACDENLDRCRFNDAAHALYEFVWHRYCDWYVEYSKSILYGEDKARKEQVLKVMHYVYSNALRLLHPLMPFVTEELWHSMGYGAAGETIGRAPWPRAVAPTDLEKLGVSPKMVAYTHDKYELIRAGRTLRSDYNVAPSAKIAYVVKPVSAEAAGMLEADMESVATLLRASAVKIDAAFQPGKAMPGGAGRLGAIFMPLEGLIDVKAELERLSKQLEKIRADMGKASVKLENADFVRRAPPAVVEQHRKTLADLGEQAGKVTRLMEGLSG